jgi:F0F1-type ATP synthase assembly protein I
MSAPDPDHPEDFRARREARYRGLREVVKDGRDKRNAARGHLYALEIPASVIVGVVLGVAIDKQFGTAPWGFVGGLLAGLGAAVRAIVRIIAWQKELDAHDPVGDDPKRSPDDPTPPGGLP